MADVRSRQVAWWPVHEFVVPVLDRVAGSWPFVGTPAWCELAAADPVKVAAIFDAAQHYALRLDSEQAARAEASRAIAEAADWSAVARRTRQRCDVYIPRKRTDVA